MNLSASTAQEGHAGQRRPPFGCVIVKVSVVVAPNAIDAAPNAAPSYVMLRGPTDGAIATGWC